MLPRLSGATESEEKIKKFLSKTTIIGMMTMETEGSIYDFEDLKSLGSQKRSVLHGRHRDSSKRLQCLYQVEDQHSKRPVIRPIMNHEDFQFAQFQKRLYDVHTEFNPPCLTCCSEAAARHGTPIFSFELCMHPRTWTIGQRAVFSHHKPRSELLNLVSGSRVNLLENLEGLGISLPKAAGVHDYQIDENELYNKIFEEIGKKIKHRRDRDDIALDWLQEIVDGIFHQYASKASFSTRFKAAVNLFFRSYFFAMESEMEGEWSRPHMEDWEQISIGSKNRVREADLAAQFTFFPQMDPKVCDCKKVAALVRAMDHECGIASEAADRETITRWIDFVFGLMDKDNECKYVAQFGPALQRLFGRKELYKDMWGANLFRLVNASAEKIPHELFTQTQHHMSNIFSLDLKVCTLGTEE